MFCSEWALVKVQNQICTVTPLYCNAWSCDVCHPRRRARLIREAKSGEPDTFITLTSNPAFYDSPEARARALARAWVIIVRRAKKRYGYAKIPYMCVFEATKKGEPHLHILARCKWLDVYWLSAQMEALTGAPIVDVRRIEHVSRAAVYVAKYVGKEPHQFVGSKRYWRTLDYLVPEPDEEYCPDWEQAWYYISKWGWRLLAGEAESKGYTVNIDGPWAQWSFGVPWP